MAARIRPGRAGDLHEIVRLYNHYIERSAATFETLPLGAEDRRPWFEEHSRGGPHRLWVAEVPGAGVVGRATTSPFRARPAYATTVEAPVYCRNGHTGRGLGSLLYTALFESIRSEDLEGIVAGVTLPNPSSLALHARFGFRPVGVFTRVGRKLGRFWDVAWFERPLRGIVRHAAPLSGAARSERAARRTPRDGPLTSRSA